MSNEEYIMSKDQPKTDLNTFYVFVKVFLPAVITAGGLIGVTVAATLLIQKAMN